MESDVKKDRIKEIEARYEEPKIGEYRSLIQVSEDIRYLLDEVKKLQSIQDTLVRTIAKDDKRIKKLEAIREAAEMALFGDTVYQNKLREALKAYRGDNV